MEIKCKKIFISYSHSDYIFANAICKFLKRRGHSTWIDSDDIKIKDSWADDINNAINNSDFVIGILSPDSVKRSEVIRELALAIDMPGDKLLPIVIGKIHDSWFVNSRDMSVKKVKEYINTYQHIEFNGRGDITEDKMKLILDFLSNGVSQEIIKDNATYDYSNDYIAVNGIPELMIDEKNNIVKFFRVYSDDLSFVTGYPFALDNQWIPEVIYKNKENWRLFKNWGFASKKLKKIIDKEQRKCLFTSLIHMRQLVLNISTILNTRVIQEYYINDESIELFKQLLKNGSIVVFLYGANEMSPFVTQVPEYETTRNAIDKWNDICKEIPIYCIRENWSNTIDQHSIDFVKFCCTLSDNVEDNEIIAACFGLDRLKQQEFLAVLKDIAIQGFVRTRMNGTNIYASMKGLSRSYFYKNFIVREKERDEEQPTLNCLFDEAKPFHVELKRIVDIFYNSTFANYFKCYAMLPLDLPNELNFLSRYYLKHSEQSLSEKELEYALTEFILYQEIFPELVKIGKEIYLNNWTLEMVCNLRKKEAWVDYVSILESTIRRSSTWQVDFSGINYLVEKFVEAIKTVKCKNIRKKSDNKLYYSFQINVGSSVCSLVVGENEKKFKKQVGTYKKNQNPIQIRFQLGDITSTEIQDTIFYPVQLFDGMTEYRDGGKYFGQIISYLKGNGFIEIG